MDVPVPFCHKGFIKQAFFLFKQFQAPYYSVGLVQSFSPVATSNASSSGLLLSSGLRTRELLPLKLRSLVLMAVVPDLATVVPRLVQQ